jgi:hypothetical protein
MPPGGGSSSVLLSEHGIDHVHDEALLGARQSLDALHLLLRPRRRSSLAERS